MDWDDARFFLAVARAGQMLGAARRLGVSQARLSRRVASLEAATGTRLLERSPRGCRLTETGQAMFAAAQRMEAEMLAVTARLADRDAELAGTVRIAAPDGFGSAFLARRLGALRAAHPALRVQLVPMPRAVSLSQREADLAIMVGRPERGRLRVRRLTDYTLGLYASADYLRRAGRPGRAEELGAHPRIGYVEDLIYAPELDYADEVLRGWDAEIEIATAIGQLEAVRAGSGIGILHDFMAAPHPELVRLLPGLAVRRTYWAVWHENMHAVPRVAAVVAFLDRAVRAARRDFVPANG